MNSSNDELIEEEIAEALQDIMWKHCVKALNLTFHGEQSKEHALVIDGEASHSIGYGLVIQDMH